MSDGDTRAEILEAQTLAFVQALDAQGGPPIYALTPATRGAIAQATALLQHALTASSILPLRMGNSAGHRISDSLIIV